MNMLPISRQLSCSSCNCCTNKNNNNHAANSSPSSYDRIGGSSCTRSGACNCQNASPFIQINIVFPHPFEFYAMLTHVYSKLHPFLDQIMISRRDGSLFFFQAGCNSMKSSSKYFEEFLNRELERHGKLENTLVNADDYVEFKNKASMVKANSSIENEYTVVTLLVLASGEHLIPSFEGKGARYNDSSEVLQKKERCYDCFQLLRTLQRIPKNEIQSVEVLWSPRKEDKVTSEELVRDFPELMRINKGLVYGTVGSFALSVNYKNSTGSSACHIMELEFATSNQEFITNNSTSAYLELPSSDL